MFFMVEMDSAPSKTYRTPKIMKFDIIYLDLQKSLPYFEGKLHKTTKSGQARKNQKIL